jgi:hypothetical protein
MPRNPSAACMLAGLKGVKANALVGYLFTVFHTYFEIHSFSLKTPPVTASGFPLFLKFSIF